MKASDSYTSIFIDGKEVKAKIGGRISEYLNADSPCGGRGKCGKCKARVEGEVTAPTDDELRRLTEEELSRGIRLACKAQILGPCRAYTVSSGDAASIVALTDGALSIDAGTPRFKRLGVAVDVGTTTLAARLYSHGARLLSVSSSINPQVELGADVITRIGHSLMGGDEELCNVIRGAIDRLIYEMAEAADVDSHIIDGAVITGNTAMLYLLTRTDASDLAYAPFEAKELFDRVLTAADLGIHSLSPDAEIYLPPCISAFVGADISCAMLACELCESERTRLLVDVGTNGEICLWHEGRLFVTSAAAGPAFEGANIKCGMRALRGAIDKVYMKDGKFICSVIGGARALGICASGLVDATAALIETGALDNAGLLKCGEVTLAEGVALVEDDIRALQLAKAAISAAIKTVMSRACVFEIEDTVIAGGFGRYLNLDNAVKIGLLPKTVAHKAVAVGNAALDGAALMLLDKQSCEKCGRIASSATVVDLAADALFFEHYVEDMTFP
ncbi:MAG: DUF4445 domain-containing protein [Clostridia bacterium]|nr:DUF4445 domain-containing protein [Clostridia bacterium]